MEDLEGEERLVEREREGEREPLVPDGSGRPGLVRFGGEAAVRVDPEHGVGLEIAVLPVDVLQVLGGDDGELQVQRLGRRWSRRSHFGIKKRC